MTEAEIIAQTYEDTCTVYRPIMEDLNGGETVFKDKLNGVILYQDIPCALSSPSGGTIQNKKPLKAAPTSYMLFVFPNVLVEKNDYIVIKRLGIHEIIGTAGMIQYYSSHNQIPLKMEDEEA